jgi:hypothetical protein
MPDPRTDRKFRRSKPEFQEPTHEECEATPFPRDPAKKASLTLPTSSPPVVSCDDAKTKTADTFVRRKYGRGRQEIDDFITQHYHSHGPTWTGRQLGMNLTTVIMRARRLGL